MSKISKSKFVTQKHFKSACAKMKSLLHFKKGDVPDKKFNREQLRAGTKVEHEHTDNDALAKQIAKAHLSEDKNYYKKLKVMERK
jgi:hypothetical protein